MGTFSKMSNFVSSTLQSPEGNASSKRLITFICVIIFCMSYVGDLFWDLTVSKEMVDAIQYIIMAGLTSVVAEKFAPGKS